MPIKPTRCGVSLRRLLPESVVLYAGDVRATSCTSDASAVRPGDVYVALDTADFDGHDLVSQAIDRGAAAIVVERPLPQTSVPMCLVPDTRFALGQMCQALAGDPSEEMSCIGVTGTDGKTMTSRLVAAVLREGGAAVGVLDDCTGDVRMGRRSAWCSPYRCDTAGAVRSAPQLAAALGEMAAERATHAVLEVSSRALSEHLMTGVRLDAACVTNITRAHLDVHNSAAAYRKVKRRILDYLRPGGICVLNADDPVSAEFASHAPGPVLTYAMRRPADVTAEVIERNVAEQSFLLTADCNTVVVRTRFVGDHHVQNCLVAAALGLAAGVDLATVARGIECVERVPGRLERVGCYDGPRVYLDSGSTPTALAAAVDSIRPRDGRRVWCVSDVPLCGDEDELFRFGSVLARMADAAVITPEEDELSLHDRLRHLIAGIGPADHVTVSRNRTQAIEAAICSAGPGDALLLVGTPGKLRLDRVTARDALESATPNAQTWPAFS